MITPSNNDNTPPPSAVKAVFFDLDGTLISFKTHTVPESAIKAIGALKEKGIKVFVATGRAINAVEDIRHLPFDGFITFNGAFCVLPEGDILFQQSIDPGDIRALLAFSADHAVNFALMSQNDVLINEASPDIVALYAHLNQPVPPIVETKEIDPTNILQANVFVLQSDEDSFMKSVMPNCVATRWTASFADVNPSGISKMTGINAICAYFNINVSETMSFGDGGNDITMLTGTGIGVAMADANENVKMIADYITESADDHGVMNALKHFAVI